MTDEPGCACVDDPQGRLDEIRELGMDRLFAEVSLWRCRACGRHWLRYYYVQEAFSRSGRWYLGVISEDQAARMTAETAKDDFASMPSYHYGGSYFDGTTGRTTGPIVI